MILLDTHVLIWLDEGSDRLGKESLAKINQAMKAKGLYVSAITFREVGMLVKKGRLKMKIEPALWRRNLLENGLKEVDLTGEIALNSAQLSNFHGDPADRIIVAAAKFLSTELCTADEKILNWKDNLRRIDARK